MNIYSRIGLVSAMAFAGSLSPAANAPATTTSLGANLTSISSGETYSLKNDLGRLVAVHFLPASDSEADASADAEFVKSFARSANALAGVREIFVLEVSPEVAKRWAAQTGVETPDLYTDPMGALAGELRLSNPAGSPPAAPATVVFDFSGTELFRQVGTSRHDHLPFDTFERRLAKATESPALREYNLPKGHRVAVDGYDVVAYFATSTAIKGKPALTSSYQGVKYQFSSEANRNAFVQNPEKYLPTYGGWCASAMGAKGTKVEIDPTNFKVSNGRLFLFYKDFFSDALKDWNKHEKEWEPAADINWKKLSNEEPLKSPK